MEVNNDLGIFSSWLIMVGIGLMLRPIELCAWLVSVIEPILP